MPSKYLRLISILLVSASLSACQYLQKSLDDKITGKWTVNEQFTEDNLTVSVKGIDEYFPTHTENSTGTVEMDGTGEGGKLHASIEYSVTQEWLVKDKILYEKITDSQLDFKSITLNGVEVKGESRDGFIKAVQGGFLKGKTDKVVTISIDAKTWVQEQQDDDGKKRTYKYTRIE